MRTRLLNALLVFVSLGIAFLLSEWALRFMLFSGGEAFKGLRDPSAYVRYPLDKDEDFLTDDYWKLQHRFLQRKNLENPHPLLGWWGNFSKETLEHGDANFLRGRRPVLLYGDSFAQCVDTTNCFEDFLNHDPEFSSGHYFLNYGVGGFGVDQISLLFNETWKMYEDPFIIFSLLTTDMDRSMLSFRDSNKPYYQIEEGDLVLKGVPVNLSTNEYVKAHPPRIRSYLVNRFIKGKLNPFKELALVDEAPYIQEIKDLNGMILTRVFDTLKASGLDYVILIFNPEDHRPPNWRLNFLTDLCEEQGVPYILDKDIRASDSTFSTYVADRYVIEGDGHPTSYMNQLVAAEIKSFVLYRGDSFDSSEQSMKRWAMDVQHYRKQILSSDEWLEQVRRKAEERGIPLDSMVTLDAEYMAQKDRAVR